MNATFHVSIFAYKHNLNIISNCNLITRYWLQKGYVTKLYDYLMGDMIIDLFQNG